MSIEIFTTGSTITTTKDQTGYIPPREIEIKQACRGLNYKGKIDLEFVRDVSKYNIGGEKALIDISKYKPKSRLDYSFGADAHNKDITKQRIRFKNIQDFLTNIDLDKFKGSPLTKAIQVLAAANAAKNGDPDADPDDPLFSEDKVDGKQKAEQMKTKLRKLEDTMQEHSYVAESLGVEDGKFAAIEASNMSIEDNTILEHVSLLEDLNGRIGASKISK